MVSIITANIGGQHTDKKLHPIIEAIHAHNPDIVLLQEVAITDDADAFTIMKTATSFSHSHFAQHFDSRIDYGKGLYEGAHYINGLAVFSKEPFSTKIFQLPILKGVDRWPRIACLYTFDRFTLCHVHMSTKENSRALAVPPIPRADIYAGDFNMQPDELMKHFSFSSSYGFKKYISYPSKTLTLDYVLLRKGNFSDLQIIENVSDHNGIFVIVVGL